MSISTKTGDQGDTDLIGGRRVSKDHPVMECLGVIDELNAFLGAARAALGNGGGGTGALPQAAAVIEGIQRELFTVSGILAGSGAKSPGESRLGALIDELEKSRPPFTSFAVPGANPASAQIHIARTVCRRAERALVSLDRADKNSGPEQNGASPKLPLGLLPYFNRLSDLLFLLAEQEAQDGTIAC
jgi:cob(I)alamin adenosyltransferase